MQRFFQAYSGRVWNEYDGRIEVLPWTSSKANRWRHIHTPNKVCEGTSEEVQDGQCKVWSVMDGKKEH